ncbi:MAG: squalene/phytoene synthase family protein [Candidatus Gracilibacteria bacterium]
MGNQLEAGLTHERSTEMDRYGRTQIYCKIQALLEGKRRRALDLVNHGIAMVDDVLDSKTDPLSHLKRIQEIFRQSFFGATIETSEPDEQAVVDLGHTLNELTHSAFPNFTDNAIGRHTYLEVLNYWDAEQRNLRRRWQVLDRETLDGITSDIGSLVASQMLFILDPPRDPYEFIPLAKMYGLAVKLADNLSDFRDDIQKGFVNIPKEDIHHVTGIYVEDDRLTRVDPDNLALGLEYRGREYQRAQRVFEVADNLLLKARLNRPIWDRRLDERLHLFGEFCHTWLDQAKELTLPQSL